MITAEIKENLFVPFENKEYDILVHGCNCFHTMSGGIAAIVSYRYPDAVKADKQTPFGTKNKLGLYSFADTDFGKVINLYTQYDFGTHQIQVDYEAVRRGFALLNEDFKGQIACIPKIGSGLAGGDWNTIKQIINDVTPDLDIVVYYI